MIRLKELQKRIRLTGERAMLDAKANDTYIVYKNSDGEMVKKYPSGEVVSIARKETRK